MSIIEAETPCVECGCTYFFVNENLEHCCQKCGLVSHTGINLTSSVSFDDHGGILFSGETVDFETGRGYGGKRLSIEKTLETMKQRLVYFSRCLKGLDMNHVERALRFYKISLIQHRFSYGRNRDHVAAVCLYLVCRLEKKPHLLLDFCDLLQPSKYSGEPITVFKLGGTFTDLCKALKIEKLPLIDPSLYIDRFAQKLEFGNKLFQVTQTALRFIQRMNRDWILTGRRPNGICGAALMMAARLHGFNRTTEDVVEVVRIGDQTLRKRIQEFLHSPAVNMTPSQFDNMDIMGESLPPCFKTEEEKEEVKRIAEKLKRKESRREQRKLRKLEKGEAKRIKKDEKEGDSLKGDEENEGEEQISKKRKIKKKEKKRKSKKRKSHKEKENELPEASEPEGTSSPPVQEPCLEDQGVMGESQATQETQETQEIEGTQGSQTVLEETQGTQNTLGEELPQHIIIKMKEDSLDLQQISKKRKRDTRDEILLNEDFSTDENLADPIEIEKELLEALQKECSVFEKPEEKEKIDPIPEKKEEEDEDVGNWTDVDDEEIDSYLLSEKEIQVKTKIWTHMNKDFLQKQIEKSLTKEETKKPKERRKRAKPTSAAEVTQAIKQKLPKSSRINWEACKEILSRLEKEGLKCQDDPGQETLNPMAGETEWAGGEDEKEMEELGEEYNEGEENPTFNIQFEEDEEDQWNT
eukprot:TRINITY_DN2127_c0_g1_i2.p1 TRINITY_DN2127_c0_g1~~TRINITY_DN2127_c0_g1_i2.p1  ORF type:complete len:705 (+),score=222.08 TRINITY_DN2127_c0_g1_i2:33-2117(+)